MQNQRERCRPDKSSAHSPSLSACFMESAPGSKCEDGGTRTLALTSKIKRKGKQAISKQKSKARQSVSKSPGKVEQKACNKPTREKQAVSRQ